jgi:hypothetical protein
MVEKIPGQMPWRCGLVVSSPTAIKETRAREVVRSNPVKIYNIGSQKSTAQVGVLVAFSYNLINEQNIGFFFFKLFLKLPPYTLAGYDLTTHSPSLLGGRWRRYH